MCGQYHLRQFDGRTLCPEDIAHAKNAKVLAERAHEEEQRRTIQELIQRLDRLDEPLVPVIQQLATYVREHSLVKLRVEGPTSEQIRRACGALIRQLGWAPQAELVRVVKSGLGTRFARIVGARQPLWVYRNDHWQGTQGGNLWIEVVGLSVDGKAYAFTGERNFSYPWTRDPTAVIIAAGDQLGKRSGNNSGVWLVDQIHNTRDACLSDLVAYIDRGDATPREIFHEWPHSGYRGISFDEIKDRIKDQPSGSPHVY